VTGLPSGRLTAALRARDAAGAAAAATEMMDDWQAFVGARYSAVLAERIRWSPGAPSPDGG
jgi:hypothetical protein